MQYRVARNGAEIGLFSEQDIRQGLTQGSFLASDLVWREGMANWEPLSQVFPAGAEVAAPFDPSSVPTAPTFGSMPQAFPQMNAGTNSGSAIAALVLGILSVLSCGFMGIFPLAAIICGHISLSTIAKSQGTLKGKGMALAGLIMGYAMLVLMIIAVVASLLVPVLAPGGLETPTTP